MERKMDRPMETIFDLLTTEQRVACADKDVAHTQGFLEQSVQNNFITQICEEQQVLTLHRVAHWLRANAKIFKAEWETALGIELDSLADDLDYLGDMKTELRSP